jgi:hypothetical protein
MRALIAAAILSAALPAAGRSQTYEDCARGVFTPRPYQTRIVRDEVGQDRRDPNNTIVGSLLARCDGGYHRLWICGVSARRNRQGYIDREQRFFGVYTAYPTSRFEVTATGKTALTTCGIFVLRTLDSDGRPIR